MKHLVVFNDLQIRKLLSGELRFDIRFFKKREDFLGRLGVGDVVFFRKKGKEVLGQFLVGKLIVVEGVESEDWGRFKNYLEEDISKEIFLEKTLENKFLVILQIEKLEQFITSPIEVPANLRKEWLVLESKN